MTFWPDAIHLVALLRGDGCVQECLCGDAASAIEGYEAEIVRLQARERAIIDHAWGYACGDGSVPSTKIQDKIIAAVIEQTAGETK